MSKATQEQQKTAVELFNTGDKMTIHYLARKLGRLLSGETDCPWMDKSTSHLTLQEFKENFDWDESYSVKSNWEVGTLTPYPHEHECSSKAEALSYLKGEKRLEVPELPDSLCDFDPENYLTGRKQSSLRITVENLHLTGRGGRNRQK